MIIEPLITVIVPVYNAELYLKDCLNSILEQTYTNMQIILVDDGSTDNSGEICDQYEKIDRRIEVVHIANGGSVYARKCGIERAKGIYVGFVDADDYIKGNMYETLTSNMIETNADFVHMGFWEEREGKVSICVNDFPEMVINLDREDDKIEFLNQYVLNAQKGRYLSYSIWSKLFKKELIEKVFLALPVSQQYGEDMLCLCGCILESDRISLCKEALYHYRVREESLSHLKKEEYLFNEIKLLACLVNELQIQKCYETIKAKVYNYVTRRMIGILERNSKNQNHIPQYYIADMKEIAGKRVVIYGAGGVGQDFYVQLRKYGNCEIVAWVDSNCENYQYEYAEVIRFSDIKAVYDLVIIAVKNENIATDIKKSLIVQGVSEDKISWIKPNRYW